MDRTIAGVAAGRDEVLERGIAVALEEIKRHPPRRTPRSHAAPSAP